MVTIRLFGLDGFTLVRFEGEPPPESSLWTDFGTLTMRPEELRAFLAQVEVENARVVAPGH
jgi:hypothetical protein